MEQLVANYNFIQMDSTDEHHEQFRPVSASASASVSETADPFSLAPLKMSTSPKSYSKPNSPRSPNLHKNMRRSHSGRDGRPKKGDNILLYFVLQLTLARKLCIYIYICVDS